jgi:hypothetical protein
MRPVLGCLQCLGSGGLLTAAAVLALGRAGMGLLRWSSRGRGSGGPASPAPADGPQAPAHGEACGLGRGPADDRVASRP